MRPVWCEAFTPDCGGFVRGDAASCGDGCAHTPAHTAPETIHTQKFSKGVAPAVQEKQFRAARRTLSVAVMLLSLTGDELANVNVMTNSYLSTDAQGRVVSAEAGYEPPPVFPFDPDAPVGLPGVNFIRHDH